MKQVFMNKESLKEQIYPLQKFLVPYEWQSWKMREMSMDLQTSDDKIRVTEGGSVKPKVIHG